MIGVYRDKRRYLADIRFFYSERCCMEKLKDFRPGDEGMVTGFTEGAGAWKSRLLAMGMTKGTLFRVAGVAPLGDPVEVTVRGSRITLRKGEAGALLVQRTGERRSS
jgi:ferrous iron transport protein A